MTTAVPLHRLFTGREAFVDALRGAFGAIADHGCREVWIADADYAGWPIGELAVIEQLTRWARPHRRLTVLAHDFDAITRTKPRFVQWRREWSHVVECRQLEEVEPGDVPSLLLAPGVVTVRLFDAVHPRGSESIDPADALRCRELVDAISQRSVEAFPATTLGL